MTSEFSQQKCPQCFETCRHRRREGVLFFNQETKCWDLFVGFECGNCGGMLLLTPEEVDDPATWVKIAELARKEALPKGAQR